MAVPRRSVWGFIYSADIFPRDAISILYNTSFLSSKFNPEVWFQLGRGKHEPASSITTQVVSRDMSSRGLIVRQSVGHIATVRRNWKARSAKSMHTACLMAIRRTRARCFKLKCCRFVMEFLRLKWSVRIVNTSTATAVISPKAEGNAILLVTLYRVYIQYTCWDHNVYIEILLRHFSVCSCISAMSSGKILA